MKAEALPFLRIMFLFSSGMLVFFMLGGALRSAGDARTPMILGIAMTVLNLVLNVILIRGLGPIPAVRHRGRGDGDGDRVRARRACTRCGSCGAGGWVVSFPRGRQLRARLDDHPVAVPVRPADAASRASR